MCIFLVATSQSRYFPEGSIAIYHRANDIEDKRVVSVADRDYTDQEILDAIAFQEQYFEGVLVRKPGI